MDKEHIMSTHGAPASAVDDTTGRLPGRQRGRLARRALRSAAAIALVAGTGAMAGLAAASPASAATAGTNGQLTLDPSCDEGSCSQVFTSSGTFTTADIGQAGNITFILIGGAGGSAGSTSGGSGGYVTTTYTVPPSWEGFATFQVSVGGDGGNANGSAGGAGGADGGGAGGNGIGGEGGGGGGGATAVYAADSLVVAPGAGNLVGVAPGGGGAADGFAGGSFNKYTPAGYGPQVSSGGNISYGYGPAYCGGAAGSGTAGGAGGCSYTSWVGGNGTAGTGGAGGTGGQSCVGYGCLLGSAETTGGGGGGGGLYGGGGGGVQATDDNFTETAGGGGAGSTNLSAVFGTDDSPQVIVQWYAGSEQTNTALSLSSSAVSSGTSVTATAEVQAPAYGWAPDGGSVQFAVDGYNVGGPVAINSGGEASTTLPLLAPGSHQVTATYTGTLPYVLSSSASSALTVQGQAWSLAARGAPGPMLLEVNGTNGSTDIWQQVDSGGIPVANELWAYGAGGNGYGYMVNEQTGQCLEVNGTTGAVDTWACVPGATNEQWREVPDTPVGGWALQVESSGDYLGLASAGSDGNGAKLAMQASLNGQDSWTFTNTGTSYPG
jgi:Bacterial Ig-like domain (group 3)/Ricin-type beta-trefoil lectin domain-like